MADHYADGTCSWWHRSQPPPELVAAVGDGWLPGGGRILDVGCGLGTETGYLAAAGWQAAGIDLSGTALAQAAAGHQEAAFLRADVRGTERHPHARRHRGPPVGLKAVAERIADADRPG